MVQWVKHLECKREELGLNPQNPRDVGEGSTCVTPDVSCGCMRGRGRRIATPGGSATLGYSVMNSKRDPAFGTRWSAGEVAQQAKWLMLVTRVQSLRPSWWSKSTGSPSSSLTPHVCHGRSHPHTNKNINTR